MAGPKGARREAKTICDRIATNLKKSLTPVSGFGNQTMVNEAERSPVALTGLTDKRTFVRNTNEFCLK
jgi:hypothetical protein